MTLTYAPFRRKEESTDGIRRRTSGSDVGVGGSPSAVTGRLAPVSGAPNAAVRPTTRVFEAAEQGNGDDPLGTGDGDGADAESLTAPAAHGMLISMTRRVTLSLPEDAAAWLENQAAGNASAYVTTVLRRDALQRSATAHAAWYRQHPTFAEDAEAERLAP